MRLAVTLALVVAVVGVAGCGGDDSGLTEDEIAEALDLRFEGADNLYASSEGDCIVTEVLTSSDQIEDAEGAGDLAEAVATNPDGTAGVVFGGVTGVDPETCAEDASEDLQALSGE